MRLILLMLTCWWLPACIVIIPDLDLKFLPSANSHQAYLLDPSVLPNTWFVSKSTLTPMFSMCQIFQYPCLMCLAVLTGTVNLEILGGEKSATLNTAFSVVLKTVLFSRPWTCLNWLSRSVCPPGSSQTPSRPQSVSVCARLSAVEQQDSASVPCFGGPIL